MSVCGRRRDMEDAVSIHPSFRRKIQENSRNMHIFGVYDGHGCSHVAMWCRDQMHMARDYVPRLLQNGSGNHRGVKQSRRGPALGCRCEFQTSQCDAVGSTAVVAVVTPDHIIVSNCGDSRVVLCRNGVATPSSHWVGRRRLN